MFLAHVWVVVASSIAISAVIFGVWSRYTRSLWGKDFWVAFPMIGRMSHWKKMTEGTGIFDPSSRLPEDARYTDRVLVVPAEKALYDYYRDGLSDVGSEEFSRAREFLKLSGQNGRKPMSRWIWVILAMLTIAEALGTGLLLAPLMSKDITPNLAILVGSVVALAIAAIALIITHGAGEDLFRNGLLNKVRTSFRQNGVFLKKGGARADATVGTIGPEDAQSTDKDLDPVARLASRIGATTMSSMNLKLWRLILSVVFIIVFGVGTTAYRHYLFNRQQGSAASGVSAASASPDYKSLFNPKNGSGSPASGGMPLPDAVASAAKQSQTQAKDVIALDTSRANDAGITILALIYVFTQLIGILTGYKYSFFDSDAEKAYNNTHGELSYEGYLRKVVRPVAQRAQMRLGQLRSKLSQINPRYRNNMNPFDFMEAYKDGFSTHSETQEDLAGAGQQEPEWAVKIAASIMALDKSERSSAMQKAIESHNLHTPKQQATLLKAISLAKAARKPSIDLNLFSALEDD